MSEKKKNKMHFTHQFSNGSQLQLLLSKFNALNKMGEQGYFQLTNTFTATRQILQTFRPVLTVLANDSDLPRTKALFLQDQNDDRCE